jgi:hypothetical protein
MVYSTTDTLKNKCLNAFGKAYPSTDKRVILIVRSDNKIRIWNASADTMTFDFKGKPVIVNEYMTANVVEATYEMLPY